MNMAGAALNPATGGPVGGGIMMMNNAGGSPAVPANSERNPEQIKVMLNTYVYEYFLKLRYYDIARALVKDDKFEFRTNPKQSPGHRKDGEMNGIDGDSMDTDMKDDIPDDLPRPAGAGADSSMQGNGFLFEWFSVFSDLFAAHRNSNRGGNPTPAMQYLIQHQQFQRMRESQQNQNLARPGGMMNPNFMRNNQMRNGMVNGGEMQKRLTPQQLQILQQNKAQQMQQQMSRGDQPEGDPNIRPATPADGENGGSPSKRPRLDGSQQFNAGMMPNGRPGVPGVGQQGMMIQSGFNPNMNQAQFRQNGGMPPKAMTANMANGMMNMPNAGSPMMQNMGQFTDNASMEIYNSRMAAAQGMQGVPNGQSGNHALQDYQMQLMLLEQQNKKRLMMARQEQHESTNPRDGQPMPGGVNMQPPGMSPSGSRTGTSPNPTDQMKRTPQLGGMPGSPSGGDMQGRSPVPMNFMNGIQPQDFNQTMFMKDGQMIGPGGPNMRPPTSVDMNQMNRQQPPQQQQQPGRMQFAGGQPMQQQQSQGQPQLVGTPGQRNEMPPPQAPGVNNSAQRNNQPASPATSNAPPTPSQTSKPNPKNKKGANKEAPDRKRPTKKNSTVNAPNSEENPPVTPNNPSTPITPVHAGQFNNSGGKGAGQGGQQPNQQAQQNAPMPPVQQQMTAPDLQPNGFPDFTAQDPNFNLDFSTLENSDVLENFDFDSFLNTSNDDGTFNFDGSMVDGFGMDPNDG